MPLLLRLRGGGCGGSKPGDAPGDEEPTKLHLSGPGEPPKPMEQLLGQPDTPPANGELATIPSDDAMVVAAVPAGEMGAGGSPIATSPPKADGTLDAASSATTSSSSSPSATAKSDPASTVPAPAPKERVTSFAPSASATVAAADGGARASASADAPAVSMGAARVTILFASKLKRKAKATRARRRAVFVNLIDGAMDRSTVAQAASDEEDAAEMTVVASNFASSNHEEDECPLTEGELERVLAALPELTKLPPKLKHLVLLQLAANKRKFRAKQSVLMRGSELKVCYVVMSGEFASFCREIDPQMNFANAHYGEGMAICEVALVKGGGSPVNIKCTEDGELLCLSGTAYRAILEHTVEAERSVDGGHEHFLQTLGCCAGIPQPALEQIASDASLRVLESRDAVTEAFSAGHSGSIFILKAGSAKVVLPRPELEADQTRKGAGKTITFKPGDLLGSTALAALTSAATIARRARSGSFAEAILSIDGESLQMGGGGGGGAKKGGAALLELSHAVVSTEGFPPSIIKEADRCFVRKVVQSIDAFRQFSYDEVELMLDAAVIERKPAGTHLAHEGASGTTPLHLIVEGSACAWRRKVTADGLPSTEGDSADWTDLITMHDRVGLFGTGDHFGAAGILEPSTPRIVSVTAMTEVRCVVLSTESFGELLERVKHGLARELTHRRWYLQNRNAVKWTDLEVIETIGQGAFGRVKIAQHSSTGNTYALKCMKKMLVVQGGQLDNVASECGLLETSLHPFILRMHAAYQDETQLYMLLEIILGGELYTLLQASKKFAVGQASFYTACVVAAIGYLNSMDIVYRDIKPENLLLDAEGYVKVVDFGFAKVIDKRSYSFCGTPEYMPPEIMMCKPHHLPCDWWSIGILVFEMLTGGSPFDTDSEEPYAIYENVICFANTGEPPIPYPWLFNWKAKDFVNKLLVGEPDERLDTGAMLKHDFLSDIDVLKLEKRELEPPYVPTIKDPLDTSNFDTDALDDSDSEDEDSDGIQRIDNKKKGKLLDRCRKPKTFSVFEPVDAEHWIA